jgi:hypothetical protein
MSEEFYRLKYLKYKTKYLELKMIGGAIPPHVLRRRDILNKIKEFLKMNISNFETPYVPQPISLISNMFVFLLFSLKFKL